MLAFIKVDRRTWGNTLLNDIALGSATNTRALVMAAQGFGEFKAPQSLTHNDNRLSAFLDRQDARAAQKELPQMTACAEISYLTAAN